MIVGLVVPVTVGSRACCTEREMPGRPHIRINPDRVVVINAVGVNSTLVSKSPSSVVA
jgi:hypothetical protein